MRHLSGIVELLMLLLVLAGRARRGCDHEEKNGPPPIHGSTMASFRGDIFWPFIVVRP